MLDWSLPFQYSDRFLGGLATTLQLLVATSIVGIVVGWLVAAARVSKKWWINKPTAVYVELFRGTPSIVQLHWVFYTLPIMLGTGLSPFFSVTVALGLNAAAFFGEAFRGGLQALPPDQSESADVLGLTYMQKMALVIIPQVMRTMVPVLLNLILSLFKETSIVATLGVGDLLYVGYTLSSSTHHGIEMLSFTALMYAVIGIPAALLISRLERRLHAVVGPA